MYYWLAMKQTLLEWVHISDRSIKLTLEACSKCYESWNRWQCCSPKTQYDSYYDYCNTQHIRLTWSQQRSYQTDQVLRRPSMSLSLLTTVECLHVQLPQLYLVAESAAQPGCLAHLLTSCLPAVQFDRWCSS